MGIFSTARRGAAVMACVGALSLGLAAGAQASTAQPKGSVVPLGMKSVNPGNSCGGFSGTVTWSEDPVTQGGQIHISGLLWNNKCKTHDTYLFVRYILSPSGDLEFFPIQQASYSAKGNVGVNWYNSKSSENFAGIEVVVCNSAQGAGCGTPAFV